MIPEMNRTQIQEWGEKMWILPKDRKPGHFVRFKTSGSTGQPVIGLKYAPMTHMIEGALTLMEWKWFERKPEFKILDLRVFGKFVDDVPLSRMYADAGYLGRRWERSTSDYSVSELFNHIDEIRPDYIYSNGVTLRQLAQYGFEQGRKIPVAQFLSVADAIDSTTRDLVHETFGALIVDRYSSKEMGMIAMQCPAAEHMHVYEPTIVVELVDEVGTPVPAGETGRVLVTGLHSLAMPMIRYELGDFAVWETEPCPAGITWKAIKQVRGRIRDTVTDQNGEQRIVSLAGAVWLTWRKVRDQHIVRFNDAIVMLLDLTATLDAKETETLVAALHRTFYTSDRVILAPIENLSRLPFVKRRDFTKRDSPLPQDFSANLLLNELVEEANARLGKNEIQ